MSFGDIVYIIVAFLFSVMTFAIIRGNFQRKFDNNGERLDLKKDKEQ
jgi:positive regulator of sigma E activity